MKKSFGSSKANRSISKSSSSSSKGFGKSSSSIKKPLFRSTQGGSSSKESYKNTSDGSSFLSGKRPVRSNRAVSLITFLVLFVCCLAVLCIAGVYLVTQGLISIPFSG